MLILGLESSAKAASAALCRDGELIAQYSQCSGLTHSRTLLPMVEELRQWTDLPLILKPNAGLPDPGGAGYDITAEELPAYA